MPEQISDDAEVRNFAYNSFNEIDTEEQCKLSCFVHPYPWLITWDSTQPVATRPNAIKQNFLYTLAEIGLAAPFNVRGMINFLMDYK